MVKGEKKESEGGRAANLRICDHVYRPFLSGPCAHCAQTQSHTTHKWHTRHTHTSHTHAHSHLTHTWSHVTPDTRGHTLTPDRLDVPAVRAVAALWRHAAAAAPDGAGPSGKDGAVRHRDRRHGGGYVPRFSPPLFWASLHYLITFLCSRLKPVHFFHPLRTKPPHPATAEHGRRVNTTQKQTNERAEHIARQVDRGFATKDESTLTFWPTPLGAALISGYR